METRGGKRIGKVGDANCGESLPWCVTKRPVWWRQERPAQLVFVIKLYCVQIIVFLFYQFYLLIISAAAGCQTSDARL
jgi:hypothetical protein